MRIKKGDIVKILSGKDRGKNGKVLAVLSRKGTAMVEGLNLFKKHVRPKKQGEKGQTVEVSRPLRVSKLMLVCPQCRKPARVGARLAAGGKTKERYCRKCSNAI